MEQLIIYIALVGFVSSIITFLITRKIHNANFNIYTEQAKAKAKIIEYEVQSMLKNAQEEVKKEFEKITNNNNDIKALKNGLEAQHKEYKEKTKEIIKALENVSGLTKNEAKTMMLQKVKDDSRAVVSSIFRKEYKRIQENSLLEINNVLSHAVTRYAGKFAAERLTNNITLEDEETKGKIIGKDGRNIKTLEMITGVDIIVGDIPNTIIVSSFNLYRRAIATKTIENLIADGRIQPAKIEDVYNNVKKKFDKNIIQEGKDALVELGIKNMHKELVVLVGKLRYRASYGQNALAHTLEVAYLAGLIASQLGGDTILARRAGLMHDIGKSLTHDIKGSHVDIGVKLCKKFGEPNEVLNAIYAHHGHEEATSIESAAVCAADALSAARPGARREVLQKYLKRIEDIEEISISKRGVINAFAINAGREIRVIVNASLINDDESILLATEIAQDIEDKIQYPGEIKVNVIREMRTVGYAR
ncbi:FIG002344: Hydrolase (HAD superfamily) [hydrothermal vent metagenome]|uniref:FIG002344: Hydrolase (HAD superfamily) n=1 Tax=hydrothermal vent metagenome TaxID=652676 RepID=A0A3B1DWQ7_9ZZZZ